jgi:hypothetical protein
MALPKYPDGCLIPNIPTRFYSVTLAHKCGHHRLQGAVIVVSATSVDDAILYVSRNCAMGMVAIAAELCPVPPASIPIAAH